MATIKKTIDITKDIANKVEKHTSNTKKDEEINIEFENDFNNEDDE